MRDESPVALVPARLDVPDFNRNSYASAEGLTAGQITWPRRQTGGPKQFRSRRQRSVSDRRSAVSASEAWYSNALRIAP